MQMPAALQQRGNLLLLVTPGAGSTYIGKGHVGDVNVSNVALAAFLGGKGDSLGGIQESLCLDLGP